MIRYLFLRVFLCVAAGLTVVTASQQIDDEFVGLGGYVRARTLAYSTGRFPTATVWVGQPVEVVLTLHNNTSHSIVLAAARRDWRDSIAVTIAHNAGSARALTVEWVDRRSSVTSRSLASRRSETAVVRIREADNTDVPVGIYRVRLTLSPVSIDRVGHRVNDRLADELDFEVKAPRTIAEQLDYHLDQAHAANLRGDVNSEEASLGMVLALNPASAAAHADFGALWKRRGDCARARAEFQNAVNILLSERDPGLRINDTAREDWMAGLRGLSSSCR